MGLLRLVESGKRTLLDDVEEETGQDARDCYQCGKCTAGCPIAYAMDLGPQRILRAIQLDMRAAALSSNTIWLCVNCETCGTRCPCQINIPAVMDGMRHIALREGVPPAERAVKVASQSFLDEIRQTGRQHELGLAVRFKLFSGKLFSDMDLGAGMLLHHKLAIRAESTSGRDEVRRIFQRAAKLHG